MRGKILFLVLFFSSFVFPITNIKKVSIAPVIDGNIEEEVYKQFTKGELVENSGKQLKNRTEIYIGYDDKNLYIAFKCFENNINKLKTSFTHKEERDMSIWKDDCVEIFFDVFCTKKEFYHIIINSAGIVYDAKNSDIRWDSNLKVGTKIFKDYWVVEVSIPFSDFGYFPIGGEIWRGNLCREEKFENENSSLSPTYGSFCNPEKFAEFYFEREKDDMNFSLSFSDNKVQVLLENQSNSTKKMSFTVNCLQKGKRFFNNRKEEEILSKEKKEIVLPFETKIGEQNIEVAILNLTENRIFYRNKFNLFKEELKTGESKRVWQVKDPLYKELFSDKDIGIAKEGAIFWMHGRVAREMRLFALQYGLKYVYEDIYKQCAENKLIPIAGNSVSSYYPYDKKYGIKEIIWGEPRYIKDVPTIDNYGFLPDPKVTEYYLNGVKKELKEFPDGIWGVYAGDEMNEKMEKVGIKLFEEMKEKYPYIREVDEEIKKKYGNGEYGIPLSMNDRNPYRWIAYRRWLHEKLGEIMQKLYKTVKETNPKVYVISYDPTARHHPFDFSLWKNGCDILTHQTLPKCSSDRADIGFLTKLVKDISGVEEVWICPHPEHYASSFTPEEVIDIISQVFRNGGTGLHYYLQDVIGLRNKKGYMHYEYYGAPERWQIEMELVKEISKMKKLKFPEPDFAILYSCDSYGSQPPGFETYEIEFAYTFLGPITRSWFVFIDDNQIYRKNIDLSKFKVIYIPFGKYERIEVVEELKNYVKNGGILISGDPEIFSFDVFGNKIDNYRKELFGVELKEETTQTEIRYKDKILPVFSPSYNILASEKEVIGKFSDGKFAIVEHPYGKGKTIYFATNPFNLKGITREEWKEFFKEFQKYLGLKTEYDIWRFRFPNSLIKRPEIPKGKCLTNNYIFWCGDEPIDVCNIDTNGIYYYSLRPDKINDIEGNEISFTSGKLTNRKKAPDAGNVEMGIGKIEDWIVSWEKTEPFDIIFDFKKDYKINMVKIFYSGQIPDLIIFSSKDGENWKNLNINSKKEPSTEDVMEKVFSFSSEPFRYLKIHFGERDKGSSFIISEIEVWSE